jgi:hypothetical protein
MYPSGVERPGTANLNWVAGSPPTPNKVDVRLGTNGSVRMYNFTGSVDVVIDVFGYYADHTHDDRYYTKTQVDALVQAPSGVERRSVEPPAGIVKSAIAGTRIPFTFATNRPSRLAFDLFTYNGVACDEHIFRLSWIELDGVEVLGSRATFEEGIGHVGVSGVTTTVVQAGAHTVEIVSGCIGPFSSVITVNDAASGGTFSYVE